jgi:hypothetical protein
LLKQNSDVITYKEDGTFDFKTATPIIASVTNRDGILYVGKSVYQFTDFGVVIIVDGDINRLASVTRDTKMDSNIKVLISKSVVDIRNCGFTNREQTITSGDRQGNLKLNINNVPTIDGSINGSNTYRVESSCYILGTPFRQRCFFGCWWSNYSTNNRLNINNKFGIYSSPNPNPTSTITASIGDIFGYSNSWNAIDYGGNNIINTNIPEQYYSSYFSEFKQIVSDQYIMSNTYVNIVMSCN